jgi:phosphoribosylglycinamide formyltransferase-1
VPVQPGDTPPALAARVLEVEHRIYPLAARWFAERRLQLRDNRAFLDDAPLPDTGHIYKGLA